MEMAYLFSVTCLVLLCSNLISQTVQAAHEQPQPQPRKKVVILSSTGGSGHMITCEALKDTLTDYDINVVYPIDEIFPTFNFIKTWSGGKANGEQLYVKCVQNQWVHFLNFIVRYPAPWLFHVNRTFYAKKIAEYVQHEKADLLISVVPFFNYSACVAARNNGIPFLLITLDADLGHWLHDFEKCKDDDYMVTVGTSTPLLMKQLTEKHVALHKIRTVGHPLRKGFFQPKDKPAIRAEWNIPNDKFVIMLMRGGTGSTSTVRVVKKLAHMNMPLHLLVCVGKNTSLIEQVKNIKFNTSVSTTIVPYTQKISDLMAVSDVLISQPSPNVCNEAVFSKLPIIIDSVHPTMFWENATIDWIKQNGDGVILKHMSQLPQIIQERYNKRKQAKNFATLPRFNTEIKRLIEDMLARQSVIKTANSDIIQPPQTGERHPQISQTITK